MTDAAVIEVVDAAFADVARPAHFTDYLHCSECAEHDEVLRGHDRQTLRPEHVDNAAWDPMCFCSPEGKAYYMPTLVRFALGRPREGRSPYWEQLLFHLEGDGPRHALIAACSKAQREAMATFLAHLLETRAAPIADFGMTDAALRTYSWWAAED